LSIITAVNPQSLVPCNAAADAKNAADASTNATSSGAPSAIS